MSPAASESSNTGFANLRDATRLIKNATTPSRAIDAARKRLDELTKYSSFSGLSRRASNRPISAPFKNRGWDTNSPFAISGAYPLTSNTRLRMSGFRRPSASRVSRTTLPAPSSTRASTPICSAHANSTANVSRRHPPWRSYSPSNWEMTRWIRSWDSPSMYR